ncbi:putative invertase inhibitor [Aristolochia californica]|uniref:putative invertase inhibitor n=1 Tax=Aristolochia californica TaxID=171875 RepID=UPI0035DE2830
MVKSFASVLPLFCFVLCSINFSTMDAHGLSYIEKVCKRVVKYNNLINYDFCLNSLQAIPESYKVEISGLLEITTHLALQNLTDTSNVIRKLNGITCDDLLKGQLLVCETQYNMAAISLGFFAKECEIKTYLGAEKLASIIECSLKCEEALQGATAAGVDTSGLLTNENNNVKQLVSIMKALAHFVTKNKH